MAMRMDVDSDEEAFYLQESKNRFDVHRRQSVAHGYTNPVDGNLMRSDNAIYKDIFDKLVLDGEEDPSHLNILVSKGIVDLQGEVESEMARLSIANICDGVSGVRGVRNHLALKRYT